jgi:phosphopantothenoylcysteine decarboxylase/phosphopantothenate--cysteine ligase
MKILVGITGGIAAYRAAELARLLTKRGHTVRCCLTEAGSRFITPLTLASLTGQPCFGANPDFHEWRPNPIIEHVDLARWADVVVVAPATADILGKTANGLANDLLSTLLLATTAKVLWAPAMNQAMWAHPAVQANLARLKGFGHWVVEPGEGLLACGEEGAGRLAEVGDIADAVDTLAGPAHPALQGKRVLITAGPTQEDLDPVRVLTNRSSGATGVELARAFRNAGAQVSLVLGGSLPAPWGVATVRVRSAQEMLEACQALWPDQDGLVAAAAVADQRPEACAPEKVKKGDGPEQLTLVRTPDVLVSLSAARRGRQWLLGFAAESEQHLANGTAKLHQKHLDGILVNDVGGGRAFGDQGNTLIPITGTGQSEPIGPMPKDRLARAVVHWWGDWLAHHGR